MTPPGMREIERIDLLFHSVLSRFFTIPARQPALGNVTFAQMRVLWILDYKKTSALNELARVLGVSNSTAAGLVDRLVKARYIQRREAPRDRRRVTLTLTPRAYRLLAEFARRRQERFQKLLRVVGPRDLRRVRRALETLNHIFGKWP